MVTEGSEISKYQGLSLDLFRTVYSTNAEVLSNEISVVGRDTSAKRRQLFLKVANGCIGHEFCFGVD